MLRVASSVEVCLLEGRFGGFGADRGHGSFFVEIFGR